MPVSLATGLRRWLSTSKAAPDRVDQRNQADDDELNNDVICVFHVSPKARRVRVLPFLEHNIMPVPSSISDLTTTAATNSPAGSESAKGIVDDYLRAHASFIRQNSDLIKGPTTTLASASTVNIGFPNTINIAITGITTINAFDTYDEGAIRYVVFQGAMTLTHNAGTLVLPGAANILTVSGDVGIFKSNGAGKWTCMVYQRAAGHVTPAQVLTLLSGATITGNVTFSGRVLVADGTAPAPSITFASDLDTGFYRSADGTISVVCNGIAVGRFTPTGFESIKVTQTGP